MFAPRSGRPGAPPSSIALRRRERLVEGLGFAYIRPCEYARASAAFASPNTLDCIGAFRRTDFRGDPEKVKLQTLVIHGDADGIVPFELSGKRSHEVGALACPGGAEPVGAATFLWTPDRD